MDELKKIKEPVVEELERFQEDFTSSLNNTTQYLREAIDIIFRTNGKHIRPMLVLLTAKACGKMTEETINSAVLLELLHTATLIHDDVVDDTKLRRGAPSLNAIFDNRIAVLVGDFLLSTALARSIQTNDLRIIHIISNLGRDLSEGELKQLETSENVILSEVQYLEVIRKKTATLLSACTEIGAISAKVDDETIEICRCFGESLGYCFQIKDDIFDYAIRNSDIGKPTGNDVREGKITLPLLYAIENGEKDAAAKAKEMIKAKDFTSENVAFLIAFARDSHGIEYAEKRMKQYHLKAQEYLEKLPDSAARESLFLLADYIITRTK